MKRRATHKRIKPKPKACDFERATGEKSAQRIAQERGHKIIREAATWEELHAQLAQVKLRFEKKGTCARFGAIVFVPSSDGEIAVKASSIDRAFSMGKLRKRFGDFVEGKYQQDEEAPPPPEPVHEIAHAELKDEWEQYQQERQAHDETHPIKVRNRQLAHIRALNKEQSKRAYTELLKRDIVLARFARSYLRVE